MAKRMVPIATRGAANATLDKLIPFQDDLKYLPDENYEKLKSEILTLGFSEAINVWKTGKKLYVLNGHQRLETLKRMVAEGFAVPRVPIIYTEARNLREAKQKVLGLTSQWGVMTEKGLRKVAADAELTIEEINRRFVYPEMDLANLEINTADVVTEADRTANESRTEARLEVFNSATIKQIVLYFPDADYADMIERLDTLMTKTKAENYSEVVATLVRDATD